MKLAIREAEKNLLSMDGGPFGACVVRKGEILAVGRSTVLRDKNASCHAEINAIHRASKAMDSFDLTNCEIFSTTEPCPMCFSAIHWARIGKVYFGTEIKDAKKAGFNELSIPAAIMKKTGKSPVKLESGFLKPECLKLLSDWKKLPQKKVY